MSFVTTNFIVNSRMLTHYDRQRPRGSGYCKDQRKTQSLIKQWLIRGRVIWKRVVDTEEVPMWAVIESGALGYTEWKSKFAEHMRHTT